MTSTREQTPHDGGPWAFATPAPELLALPTSAVAQARQGALAALVVSVVGGVLWSMVAFLPVGVLLALLGGGCSASNPAVLCRPGVLETLVLGPATATAVLSVVSGLVLLAALWCPPRAVVVTTWVVWSGWAVAVVGWCALLGCVLGGPS